MLALVQRIIDFLKNGIQTISTRFYPEDVASAMTDLNSVFSTGLEGKHIAADTLEGSHLKQTSLVMLAFTGVDGSGVDPDLTCTLTGALPGDRLWGVLRTSNMAVSTALFDTEVLIADELEQVSLTDLSAVDYVAFILR